MRRFRILVVDDEVRILNFLSSKLKASGYEVLTANNGIEGLEQAQAQEPDLIVLDVIMPKMDGFRWVMDANILGWAYCPYRLGNYETGQARRLCPKT